MLGRALKVLVSKAECVIHLESVCVRVCTYMFFGSGFCYRPCGCVCVCVYAVVTQWPDIKYLFRPSFHLPKVLHALFQGAPFPHSAEARL